MPLAAQIAFAPTQGDAMTYNRMEASRLLASIVGSVAMPKRRWSKRRVVSNGYVAIRPFCRFEAAGAAKSSTSALAYVIPTMRISMEGHGKVARNAAISGHHEITNSTPRTPSIGPDIERPF